MMAGVLLGMGIFVRMPNITHMACILVVWFDALFLYKKKEKWRKLVRNTGICIVGYLIGIGVPFAWICFRYGFQAYVAMIQWLFGMTESATDYKPASMVTAMFGDYIQYAVWLLLMLLYLLVGILLFRIWQDKYEKVKKILYVAGIAVMLRFFYGRGMFDFRYDRYFSIYKWTVVFLLVFWILAIWILLQKEKFIEELELENVKIDSIKRMTLGTMVIVLVTPLGSNNGLYPIINNLFLTAPMTFYLLMLFLKKYQHFAVKAIALMLTLCVLIQTTMFGTHFVFHDGENGEKIDTQITGIPTLRYMCTTSGKAQDLTALYQYIHTNHLQNRRIILYGDIPSVSYILQMKPAIFTTWADLGSNTKDQLIHSIYQLNQEMQSDTKMEPPIVIVSAASGIALTDDAEGARILGIEDTKSQGDEKLRILQAFLEHNQYSNTYCNSAFMVFESSIR